MQYPLEEKIGDPSLLVGREKEFDNFGAWIENIPRKLSKSRVILARRKSGKTVFMQRLFNQLWSAGGQVIPFFLDIDENKTWYPRFALKYYLTFASHYISFLERNETLVRNPLTLPQIREYGSTNGLTLLVRDVDALQEHEEKQRYELMWDIACTAPHRLAAEYDRRILVMLDEFQNITQYIYPDPHYQTQPIDSLAGSFHSLAESKIAPMLVTGSYVGWLITVIDKYLEAGRLTRLRMSPYLTPEAGLEAVYRYTEVYRCPITTQAALQINELCMADPFFISCVIQSNYENKDLTTVEGVINTVNYEISDRESEMFRTWAEYIELTLQRVNDRNAKNLLLHLSKHNDRYWTPLELKEALHLDLDVYEIQRKLLTLVESDMLTQGVADIDFGGLQDGILNLVLRNRFEKEIHDFTPDLKQEFQERITKLLHDNRRLQGLVNYLSGKLAEQLLIVEWRGRKRFRLSEYFTAVQDDRFLTITAVRDRVTFQRADGKNGEVDVLAQTKEGYVVLVEVQKRQEKTNLYQVEDLLDKAVAYAQQFGVVILPAFLSLGGFTEDAMQFCTQHGIGMATQIVYRVAN